MSDYVIPLLANCQKLATSLKSKRRSPSNALKSPTQSALSVAFCDLSSSHSSPGSFHSNHNGITAPLPSQQACPYLRTFVLLPFLQCSPPPLLPLPVASELITLLARCLLKCHLLVNLSWPPYFKNVCAAHHTPHIIKSHPSLPISFSTLKSSIASDIFNLFVYCLSTSKDDESRNCCILFTSTAWQSINVLKKKKTYYKY